MLFNILFVYSSLSVCIFYEVKNYYNFNNQNWGGQVEWRSLIMHGGSVRVHRLENTYYLPRSN